MQSLLCTYLLTFNALIFALLEEIKCHGRVKLMEIFDAFKLANLHFMIRENVKHVIQTPIKRELQCFFSSVKTKTDL